MALKMTPNMCYNCGSCHLPKPCMNPLVQCIVCHNFGHSYAFCPLSVRKQEPTYQYWFVCQNCEMWHLPLTCNLPLHKCKQCSNFAHLEVFCPVSPLVLPEDTATGSKRKRTDSSNFASGAKVHPETVRQIRVDATREALHLLVNGYTPDGIIQFMSMGRGVPGGQAAQTPTKSNGAVAHQANAEQPHAVFSGVAVSPNTNVQHVTPATTRQAPEMPVSSVSGTPFYHPHQFVGNEIVVSPFKEDSTGATNATNAASVASTTTGVGEAISSLAGLADAATNSMTDQGSPFDNMQVGQGEKAFGTNLATINVPTADNAPNMPVDRKDSFVPLQNSLSGNQTSPINGQGETEGYVVASPLEQDNQEPDDTIAETTELQKKGGRGGSRRRKK